MFKTRFAQLTQHDVWFLTGRMGPVGKDARPMTRVSKSLGFNSRQ